MINDDRKSLREIFGQARRGWVVLLGMVGFSLFGIASGVASVLVLMQAIRLWEVSVINLVLGIIYSAVLLLGAVFLGYLVRRLCYLYRNYDLIAEAERWKILRVFHPGRRRS